MPQAEEPRSEPEIIPPARARKAGARRVFVDAHGHERIYVAHIGPVGFVLAVLITALLSALVLALLLGALVIWLPLLVVFVAGAIIVAVLREVFSRTP